MRVCTNLNYRVLGTSTAAIFLSIDLSLYAPIYLGRMSCLISFVSDQSTCQERVESDKIQNKKFMPTVELEPSAYSVLHTVYGFKLFLTEHTTAGQRMVTTSIFIGKKTVGGC